MWNAFIGIIESSLVWLHNVVGSYGLAIILFTVLVKLVTLPLTMKQIRSAQGMQAIQPKMREIQEKHKNDREAMNAAMLQAYREHNVNPAMGCLPLIIQMPVWIGLFTAIQNLANKGLLAGGWLFLPSLAKPTSTTELWSMGVDSWPYLVLPILTVISQFVVQQMMAPATATPTPASSSKKEPGSVEDATAATMRQMNYIMPFMMGFFSLSVPAGLALYWVTNNILSVFQQALVTGPQSIPVIGKYLKRDNESLTAVLRREEPRVSAVTTPTTGRTTVVETAREVGEQQKDTMNVSANRKRKKRRS